jgi:hypothetical protein
MLVSGSQRHGACGYLLRPVQLQSQLIRHAMQRLHLGHGAWGYLLWHVNAYPTRNLQFAQTLQMIMRDRGLEWGTHQRQDALSLTRGQRQKNTIIHRFIDEREVSTHRTP